MFFRYILQLHLHSTVEGLAEYFPLDLLPKDYGGKIPSDSLELHSKLLNISYFLFRLQWPCIYSVQGDHFKIILSLLWNVQIDFLTAHILNTGHSPWE